MIFQQVEEIAQGLKTCTQRVQKPEERPVMIPVGNSGMITEVKSGGRVKWKVGGEYTVVPGRGKPAMLVSYNDDGSVFGFIHNVSAEDRPNWLAYENCFVLRIRITAINLVRLQSMNTTVAKAEGVKSKQAYKKLWQSINGKTKGSRWEDNPMVWRLWFEVVK